MGAGVVAGVQASMRSITGVMDMGTIIHHEEIITGHSHIAEMEVEEVVMGEEAVEDMEETVIVVCLSVGEATMASQVMGDLLGHLIHHQLQATMAARTIANIKVVHPMVTIVSRHLPLTEDTEVEEMDMGPIPSRKGTVETLAMEGGTLAMDMEAMGTLVVADRVTGAMGTLGVIEEAGLLGMVVLEVEAVAVEEVMVNHKETMVAMDVEAHPVLTAGEDVVTDDTRRRF